MCIYIYVCIYIYLYIPTCVYLQAYKYSDVYVNLHLPCCVPPSTMERFFLQKEQPKELFMGEIFGKNLWGGVHEETNDHIISMVGEQNAFSSNL